MKKTTPSKKRKGSIVKLGILALSIFGIYNYRKFVAAQTVVNNLEVEISSINGINFQLPSVSFNVVFKLINPTSINFGATLSSKIYLKKVSIFSTENEFIGEANTNVSSIDLPAQSSMLLPSVNLDVRLDQLLQNTLQDLINNQPDNIVQNLKFQIDISVFGKTLTMNV